MEKEIKNLDGKGLYEAIEETTQAAEEQGIK